MEGTEIERVKKLLREFPKGITIAELAHQLGLNRISASKYLSMLLASGQAEMRVFGPSKVFYPCQRIPLSSILNFSTSHLLVMDDTFTITDANNALLHFYSQKKENLIGKKIDYSPLAGYLDPAIVQQIKRVISSDAVPIETRITLEGKEHVLKIKCIPTVFESGDHGLSLISEDITELTKYREHLEQLVEERAKDLRITNDRLKKEIVGHKKARLGLKASEEKYRELVENVNSIILKTDLEGKILFFNEFAQHFFGYSESEIMGKSIYDTIVPENDPSGKSIREIREKMRLELESYGPYVGDNLKKNGERVWIFWTHKSIRNSQGEITGILTIGSDITEQKRMEDAHKKSEERFRLAMDASTDGIWDWDVTTDNGYFSPAYYRMLGYEPGEFPATGREWISRIHADDRDQAVTMNQDCIENRCQSFDTEYRMKAKDGSWKWILGRGKVVSRDAEGRALRMIGTHVDITERIHAEEALKKSEERFRLAMDASSNGIWDWDVTTDTCYFSPPFFRMLGYEPGEFSITSENWHSLIHPDDLNRILSLQKDCVENRCQDFEIEYRLKSKDGSWKWIINRGRVCSRDPLGRALRIIGTHIDLTERKYAEEALRENRIQLMRAMDLAQLVNWEYNPHKKIFTFNDRFYALYGTSALREGGYQMPADVYFREFVHPDDRGAVDEHTEHATKSTDPSNISQQEHRIICRDGEIRHIRVQSERITDTDGNIIKILGVNQDITRQKIAEAALAESELVLREIFNHANEEILLHQVTEDGPGKFIRVNDQATRSLGYTKDEFRKMSVRDIVPKEIFEKIEPLTTKKLLNNALTTFESVHRRKDGSTYPIEVSSSIFRFQGKDVVLSLVRDITERKAATEKIRRSEQKLYSIVDFLPDATFVIDVGGRVIAWNRAMEELTGKKAENILGMGNFEYGFALYGTREPTLVDFSLNPGCEIPEKYHIIKRGKNKLVARTYSTHLKPEGITLLGFTVPLYDPDGNIVGAIESMRDVSEMETLENIPTTYNV